MQHKEIFPRDPNLVHFPLIYMHGRAAVSFAPEDLERLRQHLDPGGGTLFADAACGSTAFDTSFRALVGQMLPGRRLEPIPRDDAIYKDPRIGFDLSDVQYSKAAGGGKGFPQLEGVKVDGHWAIIYSKYDIGCALERHQGPDCKGYTPESVGSRPTSSSTRPCPRPNTVEFAVTHRFHGNGGFVPPCKGGIQGGPSARHGRRIRLSDLPHE